ncbi:MAG: homoserine kinase type II [Bacteroidia bacterium]|jgi:homoserine kinase type II
MSHNLTTILAHFGIKEFTSTPLALGYANENFKIDSGGKTTMIRICKQQPVSSIEKEIEFMEIIKQHGLKVAYPISNKVGTDIFQKGEFPALMYDFVDGHDAPLNSESRKQIAMEVAKLNSIEVPDGFVKPNNLNFQNCVELEAKLEAAPYQLPEVFTHFRSELKLLEKYVQLDLPRGFVHGDVFPNNTIFQGNELKAIIDFEEFAVETLLFDVAMTIVGFCLNADFRVDPKAQQELLDGYESVRPLSDSEKEALPYFIRWAALAMMSWHLEFDLIYTMNERQELRVNELMRIAQSVEIKR